MKMVIVGGGIAAVTAAEEIRKYDESAEITIMSEEFHPLYSRVLLPHFLKEKIPRERVFLKKETWYEAARIEWMHGIRVEHLDAQNAFVGLSNGRGLSYDKLLIATGGELRNLDSDARGVSYLRTLDDADHLMQLLQERGAHTRAGIYGAGFIACEYLNIFAHYHIPTCIAFRAPYFWSRALEKEMGEFLNNHLRTKGIDIHPSADFLETNGTHQLKGFGTSRGEHVCDLLGVGIGIQPDFSWIRSAGIEVNIGIRANEYLETNVPNIFVAGDVSEFKDVIVGRHLNIANWMNALMQGRVVAKTMLGERTTFKLVSSYATNVLGLETIFIGDTDRSTSDEIRIIGSEQTGFAQLFARSKQLVGAALIGRNADRAHATKMIQNQDSIDNFEKM